MSFEAAWRDGDSASRAILPLREDIDMATETTPATEAKPATETNNEGHTFRLIAGTMMVALIMFGLLELLNVVHI